MESRPTRLFFVCTGVMGLAGSFLMTWLAPKLLSWYFEPPTPMAFSCKDPIRWALSRYQMMQLFGLLGGAVAGLVLFFLLLQRQKRRRATSVP